MTLPSRQGIGQLTGQSGQCGLVDRPIWLRLHEISRNVFSLADNKAGQRMQISLMSPAFTLK